VKKIFIGIVLTIIFIYAVALAVTTSNISIIKKINTDLHGTAKWLPSSTLIIGTAADTTPSIDITYFATITTIYSASKTAGDTAHITTYAQISYNDTTFFTQDSLVKAVNDTLPILKEWTLKAGNFFRLISIGTAGNDSATITRKTYLRQ